MTRTTTSLLLLAGIAVLSIRPAYAYLDPGAASMVLQGIIGGIAAGGAIISMNYRRLKARLKSTFGKNVDAKRE
ncbi:hypothetical protein [Aureimonas leprariae]|uniref:Uncharacterized protein n=1 Tax=Plantimonas leprariae TaxID=2615207 RepID=A0A7V7PP41_9HYPH|nr:hypothetical protein [Aureimonas leprariae]KAB0679728.1 hypothetical protein F6X38_10885 [Aureimonas leprariae]